MKTVEQPIHPAGKHYFQKSWNPQPGAYYKCRCGATASSNGQVREPKVA